MAPRATGPRRSRKRTGRTSTIRACSPIGNQRRSPNARPGISSRARAAQLELAVVNPVGVFGPVLGPDSSTSIVIVKRLLDGSLPGCPDLWFGVVDVRDVADLHLRAMTDPAARGERFLATGGDFVSVRQIAQMLKDGMGERARKVPTRALAQLAHARGRAVRSPGQRRFCPNSANARTRPTRRRGACWAGRREARRRRFSPRREACRSLGS